MTDAGYVLRRLRRSPSARATLSYAWRAARAAPPATGPTPGGALPTERPSLPTVTPKSASPGGRGPGRTRSRRPDGGPGRDASRGTGGGAGPGVARGWSWSPSCVGALAFVVFRGLGNATLFFYNVDEAVAKQSQSRERPVPAAGQRRGRDPERSGGTPLHGVVQRGGGARAPPRRHPQAVPSRASPWCSRGTGTVGVFASDRMLVKHSEVYVEENPDRVARTTTNRRRRRTRRPRWRR